MAENNAIYAKLQKHLDNQPVGFPATRSGAEIKILQHIFSPQEAEIACCLSYRFEPLESIFKRARHLVNSAEELAKGLDRIQKKGGIESRIKNGKILYCNAPLVVGMYEFQLNRLTPEFVEDFNEYTSDKKFGIEFLSTKLPQMRTIPVAKSIHPQHNVSTFDEVISLLAQAEEPFVIFECICRKKKSIEGNACKKRTARKPVLPSVPWPAQPCLVVRVEKLAEMKRSQSSNRIRSRAWCFSRPIRKRLSSSVHAADAAAGC